MMEDQVIVIGIITKSSWLIASRKRSIKHRRIKECDVCPSKYHVSGEACRSCWPIVLTSFQKEGNPADGMSIRWIKEDCRSTSGQDANIEKSPERLTKRTFSRWRVYEKFVGICFICEWAKCWTKNTGKSDVGAAIVTQSRWRIR